MGIHEYGYYYTRTPLLTCGYKKYTYPLLASIHLQYSFSIHCGFYLRIPMGTNFFDIPRVEGLTTQDSMEALSRRIT